MKTKEVYQKPEVIAINLDLEQAVLTGSGGNAGEVGGQFEGSDGWGD